ncbi:MAG: tetratricopeptide (TPR) repeat protein [Litorivivens sp.]|jgi:tetratricopeptide (TPR) repeat protein
MQDYTYYREAKELFDNKQFVEARKLYEKAIVLHADDPNAWHDLSVCLLHLNQPLMALEKMEVSVNLQPDYSYRYASRAYIRSALKDYPGAIADYEKAIELDPEDAISYNNLGLIQEQLGYMSEAKEKFEIADELRQMLDEGNIDTEQEVIEEKQELLDLQGDELPDPIEETPANTSSIWKEISSVFTKSDSMRDYLHFLKNGFRMKK